MDPLVLIDITDLLSPDLKSRSTANDLHLYIANSQAKSVVIDFAKVQFATRSFIDEFYNLFIKNQDSVSVKIINVPADIERLFDLVSHTQHKKKKKKNTGSVIEFTEIEEVNSYLSTLAF